MFADLPTITTQPTNGYAAKNSAYTLRCESENSVDTTWYKDGQKIDDQFSNPASYRNKLASGNLFFLQFLETDVGVYYCNVSNSFGFVVSQNASLQIPGKNIPVQSGGLTNRWADLGFRIKVPG